MLKRNSLYILILSLILGGCTFVKPLKETYSKNCNPHFDSVEYSGKEVITLNKTDFKSVLFVYKSFPKNFRTELGCIAGNIQATENLIVGFYSPETNTAVLLLEDLSDSTLTSLSITTLESGDKQVRIEVYGILKDVLTTLRGENPPRSIIQFGSHSVKMKEESFSTLIGLLSNGKFPQRE